MAKVYISFLGTNDYIECMYLNGDADDARPVRFVQDATLQRLCRGWTSEDRGFIFVTKEANAKNWLDNGHLDRDKQCQKQCEGLETRIEKLNLPFMVDRIEIPDGKSEDEIWTIFQIVYGVLGHSDEVVFDITHAFRSIPMLAIVILNYAKILKNIRLLGIYYGAFEVLGPAPVAEKIPLKERQVPLLDLTPLDQLMDWAFAVDRFLGAGDAKAVSKLALGAVIPALKKSGGKNSGAGAIKQLAIALEFFTKNMSTCRGPEIVKAANFLKTSLNIAKNEEGVKPLAPLFEHIEKRVSLFQGDEVQDGVQAARWCLSHGLIQQGFTILKETLITYFILQNGHDPGKKAFREIASSAVYIAWDNKPETEWAGCAGANKKVTESYVLKHKSSSGLADVFRRLTEYRNDLNHAGYARNNRKKPEDFLKELDAMLSEVEILIGNNT